MMGWISESFKADKRFLNLQIKRGHIKQSDIEKILSSLPDVSSKATPINIDTALAEGPKSEERPEAEKKEE